MRNRELDRMSALINEYRRRPNVCANSSALSSNVSFPFRRRQLEHDLDEELRSH